jgi:small nuclear ribonucleoprotein (snRNP)-like protein
MEPSKIVVRYRNGKTLKGYTQNFFPNKPVFHVNRLGVSGSSDLVEVKVEDLKAVFFVRDFAGNPKYNERKRLLEGEKLQGRMMEVTFRDGEILTGTTTGYDPKRPGFFLFPVDPKANNMKVYVLLGGVGNARFL